MVYKLMLAEMRKQAGLTQKEVAELAGVSLSTYRTWEQGVSGISFESAVHLAVVLRCTPNDLCGWNTKNEARFDVPNSAEYELIDYYRESTPEQKDMIMMSARNSALVSKSAAERDSLRRDYEAAC